jgi:hypothetical protein
MPTSKVRFSAVAPALAVVLAAASALRAQEVSFRLGLDLSPPAVDGSNTADTVLATVQLESVAAEPGLPGAQAWSVAVVSQGCVITEASTAGTASARVSDGGLVDDRDGFSRTDLFAVTPCERDTTIAVSVVVLNLVLPVTLDPADSPHDLLRLRVGHAPGQVGDCAECLLELPEALSRVCNGTFEEAFRNIVTWEGQTVRPEVSPAAFELCRTRFRRGDANADGRVDISDAIRTFMYLFLGAPPPRCLDAADSNDDGAIDISDGVTTLNDFFIPGTAISDPGPFACGVDPTGDPLACGSYDACG